MSWFGPDYVNQRVYYFELSLYGLNISTTSLLLAFGVYRLWCGSPQKNIYKSIRFLSAVHTSFYLCHFITFFPVDDSHGDYNDKNAKPERIISFVALCGAQLSFYMLMTLRLYQTFKGTIYELTKLYVYIFVILGTLLLVTWITWFLQSLYPIYNNNNPDDDKIFNVITLFTILLFSLLYGFILIYSFIAKLFKLILSQRQSIHIFNDKRVTSSLSKNSMSKSFGSMPWNPGSSSRSIAKQNSVITDDSHDTYTTLELNDRQKILLSTMTKNSLLGITAILLYQFVLALGPFLAYDYRMEVVYRLIFSVSIFFEILCIFLTFKRNESCYKCCCYKCHTCFQQCCELLVEKQMEKIYIDEVSRIDSKTGMNMACLIEETSLTQASLMSHDKYMNVENDTFS